MKLGIQINEGPYNHEASITALNYCKAALAAGHEIFRIFFYHDGVNNGTRYTTPPQDDIHLVNAWSELAKEHDVPIIVHTPPPHEPQAVPVLDQIVKVINEEQFPIERASWITRVRIPCKHGWIPAPWWV